jgi:cation diffusion facilitator CzcD-associated flavoprotein CzcO
MSQGNTSSKAAASDVLIVGAGPAGLAVGACLVQAGLAPLLVEKAGEVGSSWQSHYRRLHLHTVKQHSALPHRPFPAHYPRYVARQQMVDYLADYARAFGLEPSFGEEVVAITREGPTWHTACRSGRHFASRAVVIATGANRIPNEPPVPGQATYVGRLTHSRSYREAAAFAGMRVLVIGLGNTGAEIALDLAEHGVATTVSVRSPVNLVRRDVLGRPTQLTALMISRLPQGIGDAVALLFRQLTVGDLRRWGIATPRASPTRQLRDEGRTPTIDVGTIELIRSGRISVRPGIEAFTQDGVRFVDGRGEAFDAVILATGYKPAVESLFPGLEVPLGIKNMPASVHGEGALAGVHFIGFDIFQIGGLLRTISQQAQQVADAIARDLRCAPPA